MNLRQRVLECLQEYAGDDEPPFEQLVERLMVALVQKNQEIKKLEGENAHERERLREEHKRMRSDPLYGAIGDYEFVDGRGLHLSVRMQGGRIQMVVKRHGGFDFALQQVPRK